MTLTPTQWYIAAAIALFLVTNKVLRMYNAIIAIRNQVREDYSDIDIEVKRRSGLIQNLVDVVKSYAKHEKETFENVAKARAAVASSSNPKDSAHAEDLMTLSLRSLYIVAEAYPQLKANTQYQELQQELAKTENRIAAARNEYNQSVTMYNNTTQTFPNLLIALMFGFGTENYFSAGSDTTVPAVKMETK
jgi:LemA protein